MGKYVESRGGFNICFSLSMLLLLGVSVIADYMETQNTNNIIINDNVIINVIEAEENSPAPVAIECNNAEIIVQKRYQAAFNSYKRGGIIRPVAIKYDIEIKDNVYTYTEDDVVIIAPAKANNTGKDKVVIYNENEKEVFTLNGTNISITDREDLPYAKTISSEEGLYTVIGNCTIK